MILVRMVASIRRIFDNLTPPKEVKETARMIGSSWLTNGVIDEAVPVSSGISAHSELTSVSSSFSFHHPSLVCCSLVGFQIAIMGLVNFNFTNWLCPLSTNQNDAMYTQISPNLIQAEGCYSLVLTSSPLLLLRRLLPLRRHRTESSLLCDGDDDDGDDSDDDDEVAAEDAAAVRSTDLFALLLLQRVWGSSYYRDRLINFS